MSSVLQKRPLSDHRILRKSMVRADEALQVAYEVDLDHLTKLSISDLSKWKREAKAASAKGADALDLLYNFK